MSYKVDGCPVVWSVENGCVIWVNIILIIHVALVSISRLLLVGGLSLVARGIFRHAGLFILTFFFLKCVILQAS